MILLDIFLIRHGETDWNRQRRRQGWRDEPLNAYGIASAVRQAALYRQLIEDNTMVWASSLQRSWHTADLLFGSACAIYRDSRLNEIHFGQWEGLTVSEIAARYPKEWAKYQEQADYAPPQGESFVACRQRLGEWWEDVRRHHPDRLVIVGHGGALVALFFYWVPELSLSLRRLFAMDNLGLSYAVYDGARPGLVLHQWNGTGIPARMVR